MRKPVIGIIGVTAELYKEKFPEFVKKLEKEYRGFIQKSFNFAEIADFSFAYKKSMIEKAYMKMLNLKVDGIIITFFSYSPSLIIAPLLEKKKLPVLIWNTQRLFEISKNFSISEMMDNHGMHGVQDLACVLLRKGVPFSIVTGHYTQRDTILHLMTWCRCVAILNDLKKLRVGRIGGIFSDMGDFSIPNKTIEDVFGLKVIDINVSEFKKEAKNISSTDLEKVIMEEEKKFKIEVDVETRTISSRMELVLRNLIGKYRLQAIALNFMAFNGKHCSETIPFSAISKLISEGIGYGGEGDVLCAISVWILQQIVGQATFTEMFTTDYRNNRIFMSHMGESNFMMAKNKSQIKLIKKDMSITAPGTSTAMFYFQMKAGEVTLFNLAPAKEKKFHVITTKARIEDEPLFSKVQSPHFLLKVSGDVRDFLTTYSMTGGTHHLAMAYGDHIQYLRTFARIAGLQFTEI